MSPTGSIFPGNDKHNMHRSSSWMNTDCLLCHVNVGDNPPLGMSAGSAGLPGVGCTGCHGRDYGGTIGNSAVGLRRHHLTAAGIDCSSCHPNDPEPLPESILPIYYGSNGTNVDDPCNSAPDLLENWTIDAMDRGLDNDGDGLYDQDDPDCSGIPCPEDVDGNMVVDFQDLLVVLATWGPCPGCPGDMDGNGSVGFPDLLALLAGWGPCP